jgi:hypothetical protein
VSVKRPLRLKFTLRFRGNAALAAKTRRVAARAG